MSAEKLSQSKKRKTSVEPEDQQPETKRTRANSDSGPRSDSDNGPQDNDNLAIAGKVKKIFMKNFMCHDAMMVEFNQKINFIVGANGSGKSAILTALTVGLGARARDTDRGPSIKEFIKKGKSSASIEINLTNNGPMAYEYETYGDTITITRNITATGSPYVIKNWRGEVISRKREELDKIISCLNIQVNNPISVLNQDVSRSFLVSAGSEDKYKLFMKATRLDEIGDNYRNASDASEKTRQRLVEARKFLEENEKDLKHLKKKLRALESLDDSRNEYEKLQKDLQWAMVLDEEKNLLQIDIQIKDQQQNVDKLKTLELTKTTREQEIDLKIEELKKEIANSEAEATDSNTKLNDMKKQYLEAKKIHDAKTEKIRDLQTSVENTENNIAALQNAIQNLEKENSGAGDKKQEARETVAECEHALDEVQATLRTKQTDLMHLEENKGRIEQEQRNIKVDLDQKTSSLNKLNYKLNALRNQPNDALSVYGHNMPRLLQRIDEAFKRGRFKKMPLGPLGSFIKLKDPSWIPAVENQLGFGTLTSFCADNAQDGRVLDIIMKEVFGHERTPQVVISKFFDHVHNVSEGCTRSSRYQNLLDAMEISHPVIANSLIDQREIECMLLIPTSDEACAVMSDASKVPRNCRRAITKNADLFFPDPSYRTYGGTVTRAKYLQVSTSEAIQSLREEISVSEDELQMIQHNYAEVHERIRRNKAELIQVETQVRSLTIQQRQLKEKIEECKDIIESYNNNTINAFMTEIEELKRLVVEKNEKKTHLAEDHRQSVKNMQTLKAELNNCRDLAQNLDTRLNPIKEKIKEWKDEKNRLNVSNKGANRRMEEAKQVLQKLNGDHQQQQRVVNSKIEIAEKSCPRTNPRNTVSEISTRLKELKAMIQNVERQHGTKDALIEEIQEKEEKYKDVREFAVDLHRSNDKQVERLKKRKEIYTNMKKLISIKVQTSFANILKLRNYKGKIEIDHDRKELMLEVAPANDAKRPTNDAKALSGGERSYSTVAFILALWDCTGLPFYFLDEFDVFMDKVNRRIIMDILLGHAQAHPQSQFAFLTPLDTSHIVADSSITIHRLAPPERST